MKTKNSDRIFVNDDYDRFARRNVVLGDLTDKQYTALQDVVRLSLGYSFEVVRYEEREGAHGSAATHVKVWKDGNDHEHVALVGKGCAQYYDSSAETEQVVKRVSNRVYRQCVYFECKPTKPN